MLNITRQERGVILFLLGVALAGLAADFLIKNNSHPRVISCFNQGEDTGKINLNQADMDALKSLPGVGEKLAGRIIEYRNQHGGFRDGSELKEIKGIGEAKYNSIKEHLVVE
jgi:competence ComEA-like helix-hairpin-helix protein